MTIGESGDPRDRITNQQQIRPRSVTGPEQHAATVREALRTGHVGNGHTIDRDGEWVPCPRCEQRDGAVAALDELVALARTTMDCLVGSQTALTDEHKRAAAAEARADELQRERDEAMEAGQTMVECLKKAERERDERPTLEEAMKNVNYWKDKEYEARREADQLRAALREVSVLTPFNTPESASSVMQGPAIARAALAGAPSGPSEVERLRAALERIANTDLSREPMLMQEAKAIARAALAGVQADTCEHDWKDMRNEYIESGEWCPKCGAIRPGNVQADNKDSA